MNEEQKNISTELFEEYLREAKYALDVVYFAVPRWLMSPNDTQVTQLQKLRELATENKQTATDINEDIDALLDDSEGNPVENALCETRDKIENQAKHYLSLSKNSGSPIDRNIFLDKGTALLEAVDVVESILRTHGFDTPEPRLDATDPTRTKSFD